MENAKMTFEKEKEMEWGRIEKEKELWNSTKEKEIELLIEKRKYYQEKNEE